MKAVKTVKAPPGAKRLIESLRGLGYETITAIADIIDNSVSAGASEVYVDVLGLDGGEQPTIIIADNGDGMDRDTLINAMRFGADQKYSADDLGKFGLGLKTASLSQCKVLTVASKAQPSRGSRSRRNIFRWDIDHVYKKDDWELISLDDEDLDSEERKHLHHECAKDYGTVVMWSELKESLPLLYSKDERKKMAFLAQFLEGLQLHLSMVFHRFIQGQVSGRRKVKIHVGEVLLEPWDPFCLTERHTESLKPQKYKIETDSGNGTVAVAPFILPKESKFSSPEANKRAKGPRGWNYQQGFYFYRNGRLLQSGGWSYLRTPDEHTKLLRIAVEFSPTLDKAFNINVTKMRAAIPDEIREELKAAVSGWAQKARKVYDAKDRTTSTKSAGPATTPKARMEHSEYSLPKTEMKFGSVSMSVSNANTKGVAASASGAGLKLLVPFKHVSATVFQRKSGRPAEHRDALLTLLALLEAVHDGSINPKKIPIENLKKQIQKLL